MTNDCAFVVVHEGDDNGIALVLRFRDVRVQPAGVRVERIEWHSVVTCTPGGLLGLRGRHNADSEEQTKQMAVHWLPPMAVRQICPPPSAPLAEFRNHSVLIA